MLSSWLLTHIFSELKLTEVSKIIGDEWNKLSVDQKEPWLNKAMSIRLDYELELSYLKKKGNDAAIVLDGEKSKKKSTPKVGDKRSLNDMANGKQMNSQTSNKA